MTSLSYYYDFDIVLDSVLLSKSQVEWIENNDDKQDDKLSTENESDKLLHFHPNGNQLIIYHIYIFYKNR